MWKKISFRVLSWENGPFTVDKRECFHQAEEPHNEDCHIGWLSGDKFHIVGFDQEDVEKMRPAVEGLREKWGTGHKFADEPTFDALKYYPEQQGKAGTVYSAHPDDTEGILKDLGQSLEETGYNKHLEDKYGKIPAIQGDHMMEKAVGYRYELNNQERRSRSPQEYEKDYVPNPCNCISCNSTGKSRR